MINSWSFSTLKIFEQCPMRAKLKIIDRIPEPKNERSQRGIEVHHAAEAFVQGKLPVLAPELLDFKDEFNSLRNLYSSGKVTIEQEWAHTSDWETCDWRAKEAWLRLKLDAMVVVKDQGTVIDYKTGKKEGNEISHASQGQLYAGVAGLRYPHLKKLAVEFWYLDQNDITITHYLPQQTTRFLASFDTRARKMTEATEFMARPSIFTCKWCPYRPVDAGGDGKCLSGIGNISIPRARFRR